MGLSILLVFLIFFKVASGQQYCPLGSHLQPGSNFQTPCDRAPFTVCHSGYSCQYSQTSHRSFCCTTTHGATGVTQFCPIGYTPYPGTTVSSTCAVSVGCTVGYSCLPSPSRPNFSYCCTIPFATPGVSPQLCSTGSLPQFGTTAQTPCGSSPFTVCLSGYSCAYSTSLQRSYCCSTSLSTPTILPPSTTATNNFCPAGFVPAPGTTTSSQCQPLSGSHPCPVNYQCMQSPTTALYYCCTFQRNVVNNPACPAGGSPQLVGGIVQTCTNGQGCIPPYVCQTTGINGLGQQTGVCCSSGLISHDCPPGLQPYRPVGQNIFCTYDNISPQPSSCPLGTQCVRNLNPHPTAKDAFICCETARPNHHRKLAVANGNATESEQNVEKNDTMKTGEQ